MGLVYESFKELPPLPKAPNASAGFLASPDIAANPNKTAYIDAKTGQSITFGQFAKLIPRAAALFRDEYGIRKGDVVALSGVNHIFTGVIHHSTLWLGGVISPANVQYNSEELSHQLRMTLPKLLIVVDPVLPIAVEANKLAKHSPKVVTFSELFAKFVALLQAQSVPEAEPAEVDPNDTSIICFSSGTSGLPKGVETTNLNIIANTIQSATCGAPYVDYDAPIGAVLPMSHIFGLQTFLWSSPYKARTMVVFASFDLEQFLSGCSKYEVGILYLVPPIILLLGKHPLVDRYPEFKKHLKFILSGAAPMSKSTAELAMNRIPGLQIFQAYGLTETTPAMLMGGLRENYNLETVGWLVPGSRARLVDPDTGKDAGVGERGELWLQGPQVMKGYLKNPKATAETITPDRWLRTGDVAVVDSTGQFQIVDRIKELIKSKGHQVAPAELEGILLSHEDVSDVVVVGVPDKYKTTELPRAYLVLKDKVNALDVISWFNKRVARHKRLWGGAVVIDVVPKSPSGKILRRLIRDKKQDPSSVLGTELAKL